MRNSHFILYFTQVRNVSYNGSYILAYTYGRGLKQSITPKYWTLGTLPQKIRYKGLISNLSIVCFWEQMNIKRLT